MRPSSRTGLFAGVSTDASARAAHREHAAEPAPRARALIPILAVALSITIAWALAASYYLVFHDDVLARFVTQQRAMQYAYEERVGALQLQIDRAASERLLARDGIEGRLAALIERQALIERRQSALSGLGVTTTESLPSAPPLPVVEAAPVQARKPVPTPAPLELRTRGDDRAESADRRLRGRIAGLELRLDGLAEQQSRSLAGIAAQAIRNAERLRSAMLQAGIEPSRFEKPESGLGGPLVPVGGDAFDLAFAEAQRSTGIEDRLRRAVQALPFRKPLHEDFTHTSGFGTRLDPFTRGLALHTGIDLRADYGAAARATAAGRVISAEYAGGYGNMVEIDHGHGIVTRYAHLAGFAVTPGQRVEAGTIVGRVGSTGRSTGNHLHYETRIDGEPVDPQPFLRAGEQLAFSD